MKVAGAVFNVGLEIEDVHYALCSDKAALHFGDAVDKYGQGRHYGEEEEEKGEQIGGTHGAVDQNMCAAHIKYEAEGKDGDHFVHGRNEGDHFAMLEG